VRVGGRVLTRGAEPDRSLETAVDARTWRHLTLEGTERWPDGTVDRICVESLLPPEWLARHGGAAVGSTVPLPLDLNEMGLPEGMTARVVANEPCPPIEAGPGRVVLTTVNHLNPRVVELTLAAPDGTRETVRPTAFHKFYSETRGRWLSAEDLQPDERLRGLTGPLEVVSQRPVPGVHRVYNMTVEGEHVYHVSTLGVLAHNNGCAQPKSATSATARRAYLKAKFGHPDDINAVVNTATERNAARLTQRLQRYVSQVAAQVDAAGEAAYSRNQVWAILNADNGDATLARFRGWTIDRNVRPLIQADPHLRHLQGRINYGPDFIDPNTGWWWDMTTPQDWGSHLQKYTPTYGPNGTLLPTR
jgi:hypothetical protein